MERFSTSSSSRTRSARQERWVALWPETNRWVGGFDETNGSLVGAERGRVRCNPGGGSGVAAFDARDSRERWPRVRAGRLARRHVERRKGSLHEGQGGTQAGRGFSSGGRESLCEIRVRHLSWSEVSNAQRLLAQTDDERWEDHRLCRQTASCA